MPVPTSQWWLLENLHGKDLAERHNDRGIGFQLSQLRLAVNVVSDA